MKPGAWAERPFRLTKIGRITVVREDLLAGGSKTRFLPFLISDAQELVFGGPFCGGAPLALAVIGAEEGRRVTLFYAARADLHPRQIAARELGARLEFVRPGYMTVVQKRAQDYAKGAGALFLPLGFDLPAAEAPFVGAMARLRRQTGSPDQVWCAAGSGMLARCLARAFPESEINAVAVGLASRHEAQAMGANVRWHEAGVPFERESRAAAPFPSCPNYDRKAWALCAHQSKGSVLFWNVLG